MSRVYYANGHGSQIIENNAVKEFVLPAGCYVITTTVCGKTADVDSVDSMKQLLEPTTLDLVQKVSRETEAEVKETLSFVFAMSGFTDDLHMRYPGDKVGDITFYPSPYHPNEHLMLMPPGLIDIVKLSKKPEINKDVTDFKCTDDIFYATSYPPKFHCSGMTMEQFDEKLMEYTIPISELITKNGPGFYILPICRVVEKKSKRTAIDRRKVSLGGKRTRRISQRKRRRTIRRRKSMQKSRAGAQ
jgi:hypothetical protein